MSLWPFQTNFLGHCVKQRYFWVQCVHLYGIGQMCSYRTLIVRRGSGPRPGQIGSPIQTHFVYWPLPIRCVMIPLKFGPGRRVCFGKTRYLVFFCSVSDSSFGNLILRALFYWRVTHDKHAENCEGFGLCLKYLRSVIKIFKKIKTFGISLEKRKAILHRFTFLGQAKFVGGRRRKQINVINLFWHQEK